MKVLTRKYFVRLHNLMMDRIKDYASGYSYIFRESDRFMQLTPEELMDLSKAHRNCPFDMYHFGQAKACEDLAAMKLDHVA